MAIETEDSRSGAPPPTLIAGWRLLWGFRLEASLASIEIKACRGGGEH